MPKPTSLLFILVLCLAGYYLLNKLHRFHYPLKRSNGYHTFLSSATAGFAVCGVAIVVYAIADCGLRALNWHFSLGDIVLNNILAYDAPSNSVSLFDVCAITVILCLAIPVVFYRFSIDRQYICFLEEFAQDGESPEFTQLFFRSYEYGLPILFTMSDRKIYIGYVTEIHSKPFNDVHIIPIVSGYRDSSELRLVPVTPYQDIIHDVENDDEQELDLEAFTVTRLCCLNRWN
ncbi:hypothetical protein [Enterovibrio nigricans]|uniref:Uncharacterized protein n=1 Tax=Enterovibrio nigricans DSM 22720 TaxID=1121868 RepID=A0A1T4WB05_9GAMM|nr:hypothetical protein [Enterovibrio nigricans]PKF48774.1 hypothetical protein AT251_23750 [Enterovibrio nigricans]SKA74218.1 hypothetical protein SAMN02745132_04847 [Enterovibrio nigricans DSM 22720]